MTAKLKTIDRIQFQNILLNWFHNNKRDLPWRNESHWYPIFLSEIMLQQTQVEQALPYYNKFIERFPDIHSLNKASEQDVLSLWAGLGYYSRARNLLRSAQIIVKNFSAKFPKDFEQAVSLPGIGQYTASAILSIAYKKAYAVVDGNVFRVISRIFTIADDIRLPDTYKQIQTICDTLLAIDNPGDYNEAIMELGAIICKKQNPDCTKCPLQSFCQAYKYNLQSDFPHKSAASAKRKVNNYVYIIDFENTYLLVQRPTNGLLASLWEFPIIEVEKLNLKNERLELLLRDSYKISGNVISKGSVYRHQYSHIDLSYKPVLIKVEQNKILNIGNYVNLSWRNLGSIKELPIHNAHIKLIIWLKNLNQ